MPDPLRDSNPCFVCARRVGAAGCAPTGRAGASLRAGIAPWARAWSTEERRPRYTPAMARAIWKGSISFGLVTIPVSLYPSGESAEEIRFRQLHRTDLAPIQYRRVCSAEGTEVPWGEIAKGYEYAKGQFVVIADEDLAKARVEATQAIDVRDFVPAADIPWKVFEDAYYV